MLPKVSSSFEFPKEISILPLIKFCYVYSWIWNLYGKGFRKFTLLPIVIQILKFRPQLMNERIIFLIKVDKEPIKTVFTWLGPFINTNNSILGEQKRLHLLIIGANDLCFIKNNCLLISFMNSIHGFVFLRDLRVKWYLKRWNGEKTLDFAERNFYVSGFPGFWFLGELH